MPEDKATNTEPRERVTGEDPRLRPTRDMSLVGLLSIFAALAGALSLVIGLMWWLVTKTFGTGPKVLVIVAAACLIYAVAANFGALIGSLKQRRVVTGLNTAAFALLMFAILVILNVIAVRHSVWRYDATENKQYSLSDQTAKVAKSLNEDVTMLAFVTREHYEYMKLRDQLSEYSALSPRLKVEFYDPTTRVEKAKENNITVDGTVLVKAGDRTETVMSADEERLTSAILAVTTGEKTKIYFLMGHGEYDAEEFGQDSCNSVKQTLESQQYSVEALNIFNQSEPVIPGDAAAVVIAGAKHPLQDKEMAAIEKYADQGGKLFIALGSGPDAPDFSSILSSRGVTPLRGKVLDPNSGHNAGVASVPAVLKPERHEVTKDLQGLILPMAGALQIEESPEPPPSYPGAPPPPPSQKAVALMKTSAEAWLDMAGADGIGDGEKGNDEQTGPLAMAAAIDESEKEKPPPQPGMPPPPDDGEEAPGTRIVVVADAEFMTDRLITGARVWANAAFALNGINWLVGNEKLISIPPKEQETPYLTMVGAQQAIAAVMALFVVPGLVVLAGGIVWWRRRR